MLRWKMVWEVSRRVEERKESRKRIGLGEDNEDDVRMGVEDWGWVCRWEVRRVAAKRRVEGERKGGWRRVKKACRRSKHASHPVSQVVSRS
jgi:hypothetical protein